MDDTTETTIEETPTPSMETEETPVEVEPEPEQQVTSSQLAYDWIELYLRPVTGP